MHKKSALINGFVVTFFGHSGIYGDHEAVMQKAREWFPNAKHIIAADQLATFLPKIANPDCRPESYAKLIQKLETQ